MGWVEDTKRRILEIKKQEKRKKEREERDYQAEKAGYANDKARTGAKRAEQLYGMNPSEIGEETQGVISSYKDRLNNVSQSKNRANSLKRQARAASGKDLTTGESAQLARNAEFDVSREQRQNLGDYRQLIGNIASNTGSLEMGFGNIGVAGQQVQPPAPSGGMSVICTELHAQGLLSDELYKADSEFGDKLDPTIWYGYYVWARHLVVLMRKSNLFTRFLAAFAIPWARHIAGDKNIVGAIVYNIGMPICAIIGNTLKFFKRGLV